MDIKWKDGQGNIINANKKRLIYLNVSNNVKTVLLKEEVKKIAIEDGLMNIFKDFENDLELTIVIPKGRSKDATRIFNEYDKTGAMLKGKSNNFLLDLIFESSMVAGNPFFGLSTIIFIVAVLLLILTRILSFIFGNVGITIARTLILGCIVYVILSHIFVRINRKRIMEKNK